MFELRLVGIGMGNPDHLTGSAKEALQSADIILIPQKGSEKSDLAALRRGICETVLIKQPRFAEFLLPTRNPNEPDYLKRVDHWHDEIAYIWLETLRIHLPDGGSAALMIWGDPSLYDSSLRIAERLKLVVKDLTVKVTPGLTAIQLLTAAHGIPLNAIGAPVTISTGRQLREQGWPIGCDTLVVMLDGENSFDHLDKEKYYIWWGAFLGMPKEVIVSGPLSVCAEKIKKIRKKLRKEHGWIMDTYLLRHEQSKFA